MSVLIALHVLAAVLWVGGMFFAYMVLRPAAATLFELAMRLTLWRKVFHRFFVWVWLAAILLPLTGYAMIFAYLGGMANVGWHVHLMQGLGIIMILLFLHLFFAPYQRLRRAIASDNIEAGARSLDQIRMLVGINLILGLVVVAVAAGGRYL
jgi:uncharacterized membrane protein